MIVHGSKPYLECSSKGDKRFSAFYAVVDGISIEQRYQSAKRFTDGKPEDWRMAKGRHPINSKYCARLYSRLWDKYIRQHPELVPVLVAATGLSDVFGRVGSVCQATELWRIRNSFIKE